jgi:AraC-like DNA-binding protein
MQEQLIKFYPEHELLKKYVLHYAVWKRSASYSGRANIFLPNNVVGIGFVLSGNLLINTGTTQIKAPVNGMRDIYHHARGIETEGDFYNISVRFRPYGLKAFTALHCKELFNDECVDIAQIFGVQVVKDIQEQLLHASTDQEKVAILERFLLHTYIGDDNMLLEAVVNTINHESRQIRISELARMFGSTERRIHRLFAKYIGIPPKEYASLIRFRSLMKTFNAKRGDILGMALDSGYFDQSHFIKDFRSFTGMTPSVFMNEQQKRVTDFYNL